MIKWSIYTRPTSVGCEWRLWCNSSKEEMVDALLEEAKKFTDYPEIYDSPSGLGHGDGSPEKPYTVAFVEMCAVPFIKRERWEEIAKKHNTEIKWNCGIIGVRVKGKFYDSRTIDEI